MKKIIALIILSLGFNSFAASFVTWTLTVTNRTTNGQTFTLNGSVRMFTNSVSLPASQISTNATAGGSATNVYNQTGTYRVAGVTPSFTGTNVVKFQGLDITASISAGWATLTSDSQAQTNNRVVTVPASLLPLAERTNVVSLLALDFNNYSQNAFAQTSTVMSQVSGLTNTQTITGRKTFTNSSQKWIGGVVSNVAVYATSITADSINTVNFETGSISASSRELSDDTSNVSVSWQDRRLTDSGGFASINWSDRALTDTNEAHVVEWNSPTNIAFLNHATFAGKVSIANALSVNDISLARRDNSALANGVNAAVDTGTNSYLKVSGPSAAFTINGIADGRDGRQLQIQNSTGYPMTIANDSGVDATAANRIYTGQGADLVISNNPALIDLTYDSSVNRWILHTFSGTNAVTGAHKTYRALLTQTGTNAPVATVLENSVGAIVFSYFGDSLYKATLSGSFPQAKTFITWQTGNNSQLVPFDVARTTDDYITIQNADGGQDGTISYRPIEILVYP